MAKLFQESLISIYGYCDLRGKSGSRFIEIINLQKVKVVALLSTIFDHENLNVSNAP